jgi:hypothetical protein
MDRFEAVNRDCVDLSRPIAEELNGVGAGGMPSGAARHQTLLVASVSRRVSWSGSVIIGS